MLKGQSGAVRTVGIGEGVDDAVEVPEGVDVPESVSAAAGVLLVSVLEEPPPPQAVSTRAALSSKICEKVIFLLTMENSFKKVFFITKTREILMEPSHNWIIHFANG